MTITNHWGNCRSTESQILHPGSLQPGPDGFLQPFCNDAMHPQSGDGTDQLFHSRCKVSHKY